MVIVMRKKIIIFSTIGVVILALTALIYASITLNNKNKNLDSHLVNINFNKLQEKIDNKDSFILVLTQTGCSHCEEYKPVLKKVLAEYNITAYELSIDKLSKSETAKLKDIANSNGTPTTIFIEDGAEQNTSTRLYGAKNESKIVSRLKAMGYIK